MKPRRKAEAAYEVLQACEEKFAGRVDYHQRSGYVDIVGASTALGISRATHLYEETGLVAVKVKHSSDFYGSWPHDESGYRVWFGKPAEEEVEKTITETKRTLE